VILTTTDISNHVCASHENSGAGGVSLAAADVRQVNELAGAGAMVGGLRKAGEVCQRTVLW
jgi:hypothetical protein